MPFEIRSRRVFLIVAGLLVLSACGLSAAPGLGKVVVDQLQTDVVFGAAQPSPAPAPVQPAIPGLGLSQPELPFFAGSFGDFAPAGLCPAAPATSFPAEEATSDVTTEPRPGQYMWAGGGTYVYTPLPTLSLDIPVLPTFNEFVRRVQPLAGGLPALPGAQPSLNFTYETVMPQLGNPKGGFYDLHWQVKSNATQGDPEGGLALEQIDTYDSKGALTGTVFKGSPGLLLLPLPAAPGPVGVQTPDGNQSPTISADTSGSGNSMEFSGTVGPRERVDACGTWLQAWPVDGTLTNGAGSTAHLHMDVATQLGALVIAFNFAGKGQTFLGTTYNNLTTHVGQQAPSPLPKQWQ